MRTSSASKTLKSGLKNPGSFEQTPDLLNSKEPTVRVSRRGSGGGIVGEPRICTSSRSNIVIVDQKISAKESIDNKQEEITKLI